MTFHRKESVRQDDFYPTPPWATRALLEQLTWIRGHLFTSKRIWEPACGRGDMARPLKEAGNHVFATDLVNWGYGDCQGIGVDFLIPGIDISGYDWIITNPPYKLSDQFCRRALDLSPREGVAIFNRLTFVEGMARHKSLFSVTPPSHVFIFTERVNLYKGGLKKDAGTPAGSAWYVWLTDHQGPTNLLWIPPCRSRLERDDDYQETTA